MPLFDASSNNGMTLKSGLRFKVTGNGTIRYEFALAFYSALLFIISEVARYWSKISILYPLHLTPSLGGLRRNTAIRFGVEKL